VGSSYAVSNVIVVNPRELDHPAVLGVLNMTPDSFSDGGRYTHLDDAIEHGLRMRADGADLVDVGGESTRPGAARVDAGTEISRVLPVIEALTASGVPTSIDTTRAEVAVAALRAGACLVNDVSGGLADPDMARVVAEAGCPWIIMHWRGHSATMGRAAHYGDVVGEVRQELSERVDAALAAGVDPGRIVLDPGLGFAKLPEHNWRLCARLPELIGLGFPVLVGASRKSYLGALLAAPDGTPRPVDRREAATLATTVLAVAAGAWGVRVHDVRASVDALAVLAATRRAGFTSSSPLRGGGPGAGRRGASGPDRVSLTGLRMPGFHGVYGFEREQGQEFVVDADLELDLAPAARSDDVADTVHYGELADRLAAVVRGDPVNLIETLAERLADVCLAESLVVAATVTVHKPQAPIPHAFDDVSVTVRRDRDARPDRP
jgi:dihydropteroate synthase